eukprot:433647-Rhodomonas_salina.1
MKREEARAGVVRFGAQGRNRAKSRWLSASSTLRLSPIATAVLHLVAICFITPSMGHTTHPLRRARTKRDMVLRAALY